MFLKEFSKSILLFILFVDLTTANDKKYEMYYDEMKPVKGDEIMKIDLKIEKNGPCAFNVNGYMEHFEQFDDNWMMVFKILKSDSADGEYKSFATYPPNGAKAICSVLKNEYKKYLYDGVKDYSNAPHYDTCPLPKEKYEFKDYPLDLSDLEKYLSTGYFIVQVLLSQSDESDVLFQNDVYLHIEEAE